MPTGVALGDAREQLFAAAQRVLLRDGPAGLTSRAVTSDAGCAKGVLHRHFVDFDAFLAELVLDRIQRLDDHARVLTAKTGTRTVAANLAAALADILDPVAVAVVALITARDELRSRLRRSGSTSGVPLLTEATRLLATYLVSEREHGRLDADTDEHLLAAMLIGGAHLLLADRGGPAPTPATLESMSKTVIGTAR